MNFFSPIKQSQDEYHKKPKEWKKKKGIMLFLIMWYMEESPYRSLHLILEK